MAIKRGVSLYSLQEHYFLGKLDLEGCIAKVANEIGAEGVEYLPEQMPLQSFPNYSDADIDMWHSWMDKYKTKPTSYSVFLDYNIYNNRTLTVGEEIDNTIAQLKQASQLGFSLIRTGLFIKQHLEVLEKCLPAAEHYGVKICIEIHAPVSVKSQVMQDYLEMILRTGTKWAGFVPDFGIYAKGYPTPLLKKCIRQGGKEKIVNRIAEAYANKESLTPEEVKAMGGGEIELGLLSMRERFIYDNPEWLKDIMPYIYYIHGKFYEMTEDCIEPSIDYESPLRVLKENGYDGYIGSEYEGQRHYQEVGCDIFMDAVEQCKRHHKMIKRYI